MITIAQLLESVDLDFEPRWVTKNKDGEIFVWAAKPTKGNGHYVANPKLWCLWRVNGLKLAEFENKDWQECIYEVPRKTTGKNEKIKFITGFDILENSAGYQTVSAIGGRELADKINELVVAVNELKGAKNE